MARAEAIVMAAKSSGNTVSFPSVVSHDIPGAKIPTFYADSTKRTSSEILRLVFLQIILGYIFIIIFKIDQKNPA